MPCSVFARPGTTVSPFTTTDDPRRHRHRGHVHRPRRGRRGDRGRSRWPRCRRHPDEPCRRRDRRPGAAGVDAASVSHVVVGTTIGINAVLTRTGARVLYLTTKRASRTSPSSSASRASTTTTTGGASRRRSSRARDCIGVDERLDEEGRELVPLDGDGLREELARRDLNGGRTAIAVCYLFSYLEPVARAAPPASCCRSTTGRAGLAVARGRADLARVRARHDRDRRRLPEAALRRLRRRARGGPRRRVPSLRPARCSSRTAGTRSARRPAGARPISSSPASPAAPSAARGTRAGRRAGRRSCSTWAERAATSASSWTASRSTPPTTRSSTASPSACRGCRRKTIGAGGGSIGWVDPGGFLQVGPQSAGADPGPACYGQGGEEATLTDANLALGRLNPEFFLGGRLQLDPGLRGGGARPARRGAWPRSARGRVERWCASRTRTWRTRSASSPWSRASTPATSRSWPSAGPGRRTLPRSPTRSGMRRVLVPPSPGLCLGLRGAGRAAAGRRGAQRASSPTAHVDRDRSSAASSWSSRRAPRADFEAQAGGVAPSTRCAARSRCATRARTTSRRSPCRPASLPPTRCAAVFEDFAPALRGLLRLPARRHPDRARAAVGRRDGRGARALATPEGAGRRRRRSRADRAPVFFPGHGFVPTPVAPPRGAGRRRPSWTGRSSSRRWTRRSSCRRRWSLSVLHGRHARARRREA